MMGGMGSIDQFGVEFHDAFLEEDETSKAITDALANDTARVYFAESQRFAGRLRVSFDGAEVTVEGTCPEGVKVKNDGGNVYIQCRDKAMEIEFGGSCDNGSIDIKSDAPVKIVLNGLNLKSQKGEALKINVSHPTYIELVAGSENRLEDRFTEVDREGRWSFVPRPVETDYETEVIDGIENDGDRMRMQTDCRLCDHEHQIDTDAAVTDADDFFCPAGFLLHKMPP